MLKIDQEEKVLTFQSPLVSFRRLSQRSAGPRSWSRSSLLQLQFQLKQLNFDYFEEDWLTVPNLAFEILLAPTQFQPVSSIQTKLTHLWLLMWWKSTIPNLNEKFRNVLIPWWWWISYVTFFAYGFAKRWFYWTIWASDNKIHLTFYGPDNSKVTFIFKTIVLLFYRKITVLQIVIINYSIFTIYCVMGCSILTNSN